MTTLAEIAASPLVRARAPGLAAAADSAASPQLRHQGTLGGNLCQRPRCWYFRGDFHCLKKGGDTCFAEGGENRYHAIFGGGPCYIVHPSDTAPMLVALGAEAIVAGPRGERAVALADFFRRPSENLAGETALGVGEIVTEVRLPGPATWTSSYRKVRERGAWDFALTSVALAARLEGRRVVDLRIVLGGVAPVPWRVPRAEQILRGQELTPGLARARRGRRRRRRRADGRRTATRSPSSAAPSRRASPRSELPGRRARLAPPGTGDPGTGYSINLSPIPDAGSRPGAGVIRRPDGGLAGRPPRRPGCESVLG